MVSMGGLLSHIKKEKAPQAPQGTGPKPVKVGGTGALEKKPCSTCGGSGFHGGTIAQSMGQQPEMKDEFGKE